MPQESTVRVRAARSRELGREHSPLTQPVARSRGSPGDRIDPVEPTGEWKFRLEAAQRELEALRSEVAARATVALEAEVVDLQTKLARAQAEIRRLRAKVNGLLALVAEPEPEPEPPQ